MAVSDVVEGPHTAGTILPGANVATHVVRTVPRLRPGPWPGAARALTYDRRGRRRML